MKGKCRFATGYAEDIPAQAYQVCSSILLLSFASLKGLTYRIYMMLHALVYVREEYGVALGSWYGLVSWKVALNLACVERLGSSWIANVV